MKKREKLQMLSFIVAFVVIAMSIQVYPVIAASDTVNTKGLPASAAWLESRYPFWNFIYIGTFRSANKVPIPYAIIYDPPGRWSYQEITTTNTASWSIDIESNALGLYASGTVSARSEFSTTFRSSMSETDPNDIGPGKGDRILCISYWLYFDEYKIIPGPITSYGTNTENFISYQSSTTEYYLVLNRDLTHPVYENDIGEEYSRPELEYYGIFPENKTNTAGQYSYHIRVAYSSPADVVVSYELESGFATGIDAEIDLAGGLVPKAKFKFILSFNYGYEYDVRVHIGDPDYSIEMDLTTNGPAYGDIPHIDVSSWTFWFSNIEMTHKPN